jgi:hypothetical protein
MMQVGTLTTDRDVVTPLLGKEHPAMNSATATMAVRRR